MRMVDLPHAHGLLLRVLDRLSQREWKQRRIRMMERGVVSTRVNAIAGKDQHPATFADELLETLANLRRQEFDITQNDNLIIGKAFLAQAFPGDRLGIEQRTSHYATGP